MIWPLKLYTTEESFLIISVCIPVWFKFRQGFKPEKTVKDRPFAPRLTAMVGEEVSCLHAYVLGAQFRVRSNKTMREIVKKGSKRVLWSFFRGWSQVFNSAII